MKHKRVIILDDHTLFLKGMSLILKECCADCDVFTYQSISTLYIDKPDFNSYDLLISDIELPGEDAFDLLSVLKRDFPDLPVLVVSMHKKVSILKKCKALGIEGYMLKHEDRQLTKAIEIIIKGGDYYSNEITDFCTTTEKNYNSVSIREEEIIKLIAGGYSNSEIAGHLSITAETIKTHKKNIKLKLELNSTHEITEYAQKNYLL